MTKKDYIAIAEIINKSLGFEDLKMRQEISYGLADFFKSDNPRFDRQRFQKACVGAAKK